MKRTALALLCTASLTIVYAQKQATRQLSKAAIEVEGTKLRLGMTKAQVAEKLVGHGITKISDDEWMVGTLKELRAGREGPTLQFTDGVLSYADCEWTTGDNDVAKALFGAVSTLNNEGFSACTVTADTRSSPDISAQRVWIMCGEKSVSIVRRSFFGQSNGSVYEQLGRKRELTQ